MSRSWGFCPWAALSIILPSDISTHLLRSPWFLKWLTSIKTLPAYLWTSCLLPSLVFSYHPFPLSLPELFCICKQTFICSSWVKRQIWCQWLKSDCFITVQHPYIFFSSKMQISAIATKIWYKPLGHWCWGLSFYQRTLLGVLCPHMSMNVFMNTLTYMTQTVEWIICLSGEQWVWSNVFSSM